jgi:hypothetical protein
LCGEIEEVYIVVVTAGCWGVCSGFLCGAGLSRAPSALLLLLEVLWEALRLVKMLVFLYSL